ncbi:hypothetical protein BKA56DRAFT_287143 [Ilyonectria sp. MPI-CAGE-AT-0026]|nr:hypothetical protein BKA56DRAFT_287143 [Ilyonectria sp. MPI-CAGE-AT-0026]
MSTEEPEPATKRRKTVVSYSLTPSGISCTDSIPLQSSKSLSEEEPRGVPRDVPCKGCVRAAIAGKGDVGRCYESAGRSQRCWSCKKGGHQCSSCPSVMVPIAMRLIMALDADHKKVYVRPLPSGITASI